MDSLYDRNYRNSTGTGGGVKIGPHQTGGHPKLRSSVMETEKSKKDWGSTSSPSQEEEC